MDIDKEIEQLNEMRFWRLENIRCGEALSSILHAKQDFRVFHVLKSLVSVFLKWHLALNKKGSGQSVFFFTPSYSSREEYERDFINATTCVNSPTVFMAQKKMQFKLRRIFGLLYWISWILKMRDMKFQWGFRIVCCNQLLLAYYCTEDIKYSLNNVISNFKLGVTFSDVHPIDYFITSYFNNIGICTTTLQHAVFYHKTHSYAYKYSRSTYFLAISEYAVLEAIKSGYKGKNMLVSGPMKYFDIDISNKKVNFKSDVVGIALSGTAFEKENRKLMEYGKYIKDKYGYDILIRPHPSVSVQNYTDIINLSTVKISAGDINKFAEQCVFVILGNTNTFADLIVIGTPSLRMITPCGDDFFEDISDFRFADKDTLDKLIRSMRTESYDVFKKIKQIKHRLCPDGAIRDNYTKAFCQILKEID